YSRCCPCLPPARGRSLATSSGHLKCDSRCDGLARDECCIHGNVLAHRSRDAASARRSIYVQAFHLLQKPPCVALIEEATCCAKPHFIRLTARFGKRGPVHRIDADEIQAK